VLQIAAEIMSVVNVLTLPIFTEKNDTVHKLKKCEILLKYHSNITELQAKQTPEVQLDERWVHTP